MEITATDTLDVSGETDLGNTFNFCDAVTSIYLGNVAPYNIGTMFNASGLARLDAASWDVTSLCVSTLFLSPWPGRDRSQGCGDQPTAHTTSIRPIPNANMRRNICDRGENSGPGTQHRDVVRTGLDTGD